MLGIEFNSEVLQALALALGPLAVFYTPTEEVDAILMDAVADATSAQSDATGMDAIKSTES